MEPQHLSRQGDFHGIEFAAPHDGLQLPVRAGAELDPVAQKIVFAARLAAEREIRGGKGGQAHRWSISSAAATTRSGVMRSMQARSPRRQRSRKQAAQFSILTEMTRCCGP